MKKHWAIVLPLLVVGCTGPEDLNNDGIADGIRDPDSVSVVAPSNPKGTVSGQVLNTRLEPLADANVAMTIGSATTDAPVTAKTDAAGNYMFTNVPAGSQVLVTISKDGYATLRASAIVPSAAGNIPINNGNANIGAVSLAETRTTVRFTLTTPTGRPATDAQAYIEALPAGVVTTAGGSTAGVSIVSSVFGSAKADAQGVITFQNMPSAVELSRLGRFSGSSAYRLWVDPVDTNGDGIIDAGGYSRDIPPTEVALGVSRIIQLDPPRNEGTGSSNSFSLQVSNVPSLTFASSGKASARDPLRNLLRSGESIYVAFSQPVQRDSLVAIITDEGGREAGNATATANATSDAFTVSLPAAPTIREGQKYNVLMRATSAYDGSTVSWKGFFISGDPKSPKSADVSSLVTSVAYKDGSTGAATNDKLDAGECVIVTFNQVIVAPETGVVAVEAFINSELGNTNDVGEFNAKKGFPLIKAAPPYTLTNCLAEEMLYPIDTSSFAFTPRFYFTISTTGTVNIPTGTQVRIGFGKQLLSGGNLYETAWATPLTRDVDVALTKL